jgi:15-cis-phytoene synthase
VGVSSSLERSYQYCSRLARHRARNFYYGFWLLPKPRREAFCAVYAFMRYCDDVADGASPTAEKAERLREWHQVLERALGGEYGDNPMLPAFHDAVGRYHIPPEYLHALIAGTEMDLAVRSYRTFDDLHRYCYSVAGVVGLCSLHMFGFRDPQAKLLAERCGIAFQLTNILRDVAEDAAAGRIYLPLEDLERFGYATEDLTRGVRSPAYCDLMRFEIQRAHDYYEQAAPLIEMVEPESRPALWALISIYRGVLGAVERRVEAAAVAYGAAHTHGVGASPRPAALTDMEKIALVFRATMMRLQLRAGGRPDWRVRA